MRSRLPFSVYFSIESKPYALDFESHAKECLRLVSHKLYLVSRIRNIINKDQAVTIYKSKILPYFDYGDIFYNKTYSRTLDKLQKLQNRAIRLCLGRDSRYNVLLLHTVVIVILYSDLWLLISIDNILYNGENLSLFISTNSTLIYL